MLLDVESVNQTVVIASLCKSIITRHQQRHCFACINEKYRSLRVTTINSQSPSEVGFFFEDSYNSKCISIALCSIFRNVITPNSVTLPHIVKKIIHLHFEIISVAYLSRFHG